MTSIAANLQKIEQQIATAAARAGRDSSEIRLLPVSKTKPPEAVLEAHAAGYRRFGENKVQEAQGKWESLREVADIEWAVIGQQINTALPRLFFRRPLGRQRGFQTRRAVRIDIAGNGAVGQIRQTRTGRQQQRRGSRQASGRQTPRRYFPYSVQNLALIFTGFVFRRPTF